MSTLLFWLALFAAMVGGTILSLAAYRATRALYGDHEVESTIDFARVTLVRIGVIHGLIIALVFAEGKTNERDLRGAIIEEARAVSSIYYELRRFDPVNTVPVQRTVARYVHSVIEFDWPSLAEDARLSEASWALWDTLIDQALALDGEGDPRREAIRARIVEQAYEIETLRVQRALGARSQPSLIFWVAAVGGMMVMMGLFFPWRPTRAVYVQFAGLAGFSTLVLFLVFDLGNPFDGLAALSPEPFEFLLGTELGELL